MTTNTEKKQTLHKDFRYIQAYYPDRIPVLLEMHSSYYYLKKHKFIVPKDFTLGRFVQIVSEYVYQYSGTKQPSTHDSRVMLSRQALFLLFGKSILPISSTLETIYQEYHQRNGFLVGEVMVENTFGISGNSVSIHELQTGDVMLVHANAWYDKMIEWFTGSVYCHVGMVIVNPYPWFTSIPLPLGVYVLESTISTHPEVDVENQRPKFGTQLTSLADFMARYHDSASFFIRSLECVRNNLFYTILASAHLDVHNTLYDVNPWDWICAEFQLQLGLQQHHMDFFCSALIAYMFVRLTFLPPSIPWSIIRPLDWGTEQSWYRRHTRPQLPFQHCILHPEKPFYIVSEYKNES